uniref:Retrotransposon gag domain-containing protein n=1 Tax=Solanum lycopersicum TaxID=4081 RepID=A0A3Q7HAF2_SOLLC
MFKVHGHEDYVKKKDQIILNRLVDHGVIHGTSSMPDFSSIHRSSVLFMVVVGNPHILECSLEGVLHKEIAFLTQGTTAVSTYFSKLSDLWDEFDALIPPPTLNDSYSRAKSQVLMMQPLPSLNQIYALIIQEESQRSLTSVMPEDNCDYCRKFGHTRAVCKSLLGQFNARNQYNRTCL